ncbi:MAG: B12-binding domain-containing radical SAM protein [Nitrospirota bacterium]
MKDLLQEKTKCLLIQPLFSTFSFWNYRDVCRIAGAQYPAAPLGLMTLAALLPQHWDFKLIDENVEPLKDEHFDWADIVFAGAMLPQQDRLLAIIKKAHEKSRPIVVGGPDPSSQPDIYREADFLVLGEAEVTIPPFINDLGNKVTSGTYASAEKADMAEAVIPRFDLVRFKDYLHIGVQFSRGCPHNCEFCDIIELFGRKPRTKTPDQVIRELQRLYDMGYRGHVDFVDDNLIGHKRDVKQALLAVNEWLEVRNHPFFFSTEASINLAKEEELLQLMREADFRYIFIGVETPDEESLKQAQKWQNVNISMADSIRLFYDYGMIVNAGFIIGFDSETERSAGQMVTFIQDTGICMAMVGMLVALPNTQLTRRLKKEGRLFDDGIHLADTTNEIDQTTSGLNFKTLRPRPGILSDYIDIVRHIYEPENYYRRVLYTACHLKPAAKYKPGLKKVLVNIRSFLRLCRLIGLKRETALLFWAMIFKVLMKNPPALEAAVNLAAMHIHFYKQSRFLVDLLEKKKKFIREIGENRYNEMMLHRNTSVRT